MNLRMQYARPRNLEQATALMDALGTGTMVIAGGQELMPHLNYGKISPSVFLDVSGLSELRGVEETTEGVSIGALTVHRQIQTDPIISKSLPLLAYAAKQIGGGRQVHNQGTIGGNIVAMHPLYDIIPSLLALGAQVQIAGPEAIEIIPLSKLLTEASYQLGAKELLTRIIVPPMDSAQSWAYKKLKITTGSYSSANAVAIVDSAEDLNVRLVVGAVTELPIDLTESLAAEMKNSPNAEIDVQVETVCNAAVTDPISDQRGHGEYRKAMAGVVAKRAVNAAIEKLEAK